MSKIIKILLLFSCPLAWANRIEGTWEGNATLYVSTSGKVESTYGGVRFASTPEGDLQLRECWLWEVNKKWKSNCFRMTFKRAGSELTYEGNLAGTIEDDSLTIDLRSSGFHLEVSARLGLDNKVTYHSELNSARGVKIIKEASGLQ